MIYYVVKDLVHIINVKIGLYIELEKHMFKVE